MKKDSQVTNEVTENYFDAIAEGYGTNNGSNVDKYSVIRQFLLPLKSHSEILECGGGGGFYTTRFLEDGYCVTCVDLSEKALENNRNNAKQIGKSDQLKTVKAGFVEYCEGHDGFIDQIIFIKVFHHFDNLTSIGDALDKAIQKVRRGGQIIIFEPNGANPLWRLLLSVIKDKVTGRPKWVYEQNMRLTTEHNFRKLLSSKSIDEYELRYHYVIPATLIQHHWLGRLGLRKLNTALERWPLKHWTAFNFSIIIPSP